MSKPRRSMDHAEEAVKSVVEAALPGARMEFQDNQSHGECDFNLYRQNRTVAAVEVTMSADQDRKWMSARIRNKKDGGSAIGAKYCKKSWIVFPMGDAKAIPVIKKRADEYLAKVEQAGLERFNYLGACAARQEPEAGLEKVTPPPVPRCVEDICCDLKIASGSVVGTGASPRILVGHPAGGGAVGATVAIRAGEREAWKRDNRRKLATAKTDERHIAVYMDAGVPCVALLHFEPPSTLPNLPDEITHIWLIGHGEKVGHEFDEYVVWRASTKESWSSERVFVPQATAP